MTPIAIAAAAPAPAAFSQMMPVTVQASSAADLDRLRALVAGIQPSGENVDFIPPTNKTESSGFRTMGESILDGVAKFNTGYNDSLSNITNKLEHIASTDPLELGSNFGELMALQVEIARWTMSVMGVDNASKAGTNTIKELSKGG
jgi:hypothetical protein